jgi:hypothetical protein
VSFEAALSRAIKRDIKLYADEKALLHKYENRYFAGQRNYFDACSPKKHADLIMDNNDLTDPVLVEIS